MNGACPASLVEWLTIQDLCEHLEDQKQQEVGEAERRGHGHLGHLERLDQQLPSGEIQQCSHREGEEQRDGMRGEAAGYRRPTRAAKDQEES